MFTLQESIFYHIAANDTLEANDYWLLMQIYNFSNSHLHFSGSSFSKPKYVASPYGAWLAASNSPTGDTFSYWFWKNILVFL